MKIVALYPTDSGYSTDGISTKPVIDFLTKALQANGIEVQIISPGIGSKSKGRLKSEQVINEHGVTVEYPSASAGTSTRAVKQIRLWWWLSRTLMKGTERGEEILVYHSMKLVIPIHILQIIGRVRILLNVGEFFQTLYPMKRWKQVLEKRYIKSAGRYIFVTRLLVDQVKALRKEPFEYVLLYGPYEREPVIGNQEEKSEITRLLYVGKISADKGIDRTLALAKYLDGNYEIRILGYCETYDEEKLKTSIELSNESNLCKIIFDGLKYGDAYKEYVQNCHLGLVLQDMDASYNDNSFPSKILSFLANGLEVIAPNIPTIGTSPLGDALYLYENENPSNIANLIKSIDFSQKRNQPNTLTDLKTEFIHEIGILLSSS